MNCENCGVSFFDKMLHRTEPTGQRDAAWMCIDCIKAKEPELGKNIESESIFKDVEEIVKVESGKANNTDLPF